MDSEIIDDVEKAPDLQEQSTKAPKMTRQPNYKGELKHLKKILVIHYYN